MAETKAEPTTPNAAPHGEWHRCPVCRMSQNYEPRTEPWKVGDYVLHDADAKNERMLLRVWEVTGAHTCTVKYVNIPAKELSRDLRKPFLAHMCSLHDPARWGINTETAPIEGGQVSG